MVSFTTICARAERNRKVSLRKRLKAFCSIYRIITASCSTLNLTFGLFWRLVSQGVRSADCIVAPTSWHSLSFSHSLTRSRSVECGSSSREAATVTAGGPLAGCTRTVSAAVDCLCSVFITKM